MARNLLKAGYTVIAYDRVEKNIAEVEGATPAGSIAEVTKSATRIVTMLPDSPHVDEVLLGAGGIVEHAAPGTIVADMSTISPKVTRAIFARARDKNIGFLDAPVSGGKKGAIAGALSIMVGGEEQDFAAFLPIFEAMGTTIVHVGPSGAGQTVKLCNQAVVAVNIQGICEAFALAKAAGMDLNIVRQVLQGGAAGSWMLDNLAPQMIEGDASAGFRIGLQLKDLRLAIESAFDSDVPMPATHLATTMYLEARAHGEGDNGNQSMYRVYERLANRVFQ